jgi:hypothetical protein
LPISEGAFLFIDRDEEDQRVSIYLTLKADIYAWRTTQDNCAYAERNAPLLARFLGDVRERLRGVSSGIDSNDYDVDENGFVGPA